MKSLPSFRFAVISDLHTGLTPGQGWHNRYLSPAAEATLGATVDDLNRQRPDLVVVVGDVTDAGTEDQLAEAAFHLDRLAVPYVVCKGNHDQRTLSARAAFERVWGRRAPVGVIDGSAVSLPAGIALLVLDAWWVADDGSRQLERPTVVRPPVRMAVPEEQIVGWLARLEAIRPRLLLVFSHFPLLPQHEYLRSVQGKDAGHLGNGAPLLAALADRVGAVACFAGHQHFHHICSAGRWLHCTTAALAEYPGEYRLVEVSPAGLHICTASAIEPTLVQAALQDSAWVAGRPADRDHVWRPDP